MREKIFLLLYLIPFAFAKEQSIQISRDGPTISRSDGKEQNVYFNGDLSKTDEQFAEYPDSNSFYQIKNPNKHIIPELTFFQQHDDVLLSKSGNGNLLRDPSSKVKTDKSSINSVSYQNGRNVVTCSDQCIPIYLLESHGIDVKKLLKHNRRPKNHSENAPTENDLQMVNGKMINVGKDLVHGKDLPSAERNWHDESLYIQQQKKITIERVKYILTIPNVKYNDEWKVKNGEFFRDFEQSLKSTLTILVSVKYNNILFLVELISIEKQPDKGGVIIIVQLSLPRSNVAIMLMSMKNTLLRVVNEKMNTVLSEKDYSLSTVGYLYLTFDQLFHSDSSVKTSPLYESITNEVTMLPLNWYEKDADKTVEKCQLTAVEQVNLKQFKLFIQINLTGDPTPQTFISLITLHDRLTKIFERYIDCKLNNKLFFPSYFADIVIEKMIIDYRVCNLTDLDKDSLSYYKKALKSLKKIAKDEMQVISIRNITIENNEDLMFQIELVPNTRSYDLILKIIYQGIRVCTQTRDDSDVTIYVQTRLYFHITLQGNKSLNNLDQKSKEKIERAFSDYLLKLYRFQLWSTDAEKSKNPDEKQIIPKDHLANVYPVTSIRFESISATDGLLNLLFEVDISGSLETSLLKFINTLLIRRLLLLFTNNYKIEATYQFEFVSVPWKDDYGVTNNYVNGIKNAIKTYFNDMINEFGFFPLIDKFDIELKSHDNKLVIVLKLVTDFAGKSILDRLYELYDRYLHKKINPCIFNPCPTDTVCQETCDLYNFGCYCGSSDVGICGKYAYCVNTSSNTTEYLHYECLCTDGYIKSSNSLGNCVKRPKECTEIKCGPNAKCVKCRCQEGFEGLDTGEMCVDTNPCKQPQCICPPDSHCVRINSTRDYYCKCRHEEKQGPCGENQMCISKDPSSVYNISKIAYECRCIKDYEPKITGDGCKRRPLLCSRDKICGNYSVCVPKDDYHLECKCREGFIPKKNSTDDCEDEDECKTKFECCGENSICENIVGSYLCHCKPGYEHDVRKKCVDIDECKIQPPLCKEHELCRNTISSYDCDCKPKYRRNVTSGTCLPIDPCEHNPCGSNSKLCEANMLDLTYICLKQMDYVAIIRTLKCLPEYSDEKSEIFKKLKTELEFQIKQELSSFNITKCSLNAIIPDGITGTKFVFQIIFRDNFHEAQSVLNNEKFTKRMQNIIYDIASPIQHYEFLLTAPYRTCFSQPNSTEYIEFARHCIFLLKEYLKESIPEQSDVLRKCQLDGITKASDGQLSFKISYNQTIVSRNFRFYSYKQSPTADLTKFETLIYKECILLLDENQSDFIRLIKVPSIEKLESGGFAYPIEMISSVALSFSEAELLCLEALEKVLKDVEIAIFGTGEVIKPQSVCLSFTLLFENHTYTDDLNKIDSKIYQDINRILNEEISKRFINEPIKLLSWKCEVLKPSLGTKIKLLVELHNNSAIYVTQQLKSIFGLIIKNGYITHDKLTPIDYRCDFLLHLIILFRIKDAKDNFIPDYHDKTSRSYKQLSNLFNLNSQMSPYNANLYSISIEDHDILIQIIGDCLPDTRLQFLSACRRIINEKVLILFSIFRSSLSSYSFTTIEYYRSFIGLNWLPEYGDQTSFAFCNLEQIIVNGLINALKIDKLEQGFLKAKLVWIRQKSDCIKGPAQKKPCVEFKVTVDVKDTYSSEVIRDQLIQVFSTDVLTYFEQSLISVEKEIMECKIILLGVDYHTDYNDRDSKKYQQLITSLTQLISTKLIERKIANAVLSMNCTQITKYTGEEQNGVELTTEFLVQQIESLTIQQCEEEILTCLKEDVVKYWQLISKSEISKRK
ncbi:unnamed protein product [Didymodactylos carnosus]|uniref:EGF-like domain-containing protein n=1 Tax=Didymodactylos carnosus TaxID=1234261 RepID=A0A8S2GMS9_9BILA|nr:unnamed protein product [Didymodactylos carnosus]CAF3537438.1 unnamed protein product [Didymodactylos carnosus]